MYLQIKDLIRKRIEVSKTKDTTIPAIHLVMIRNIAIISTRRNSNGQKVLCLQRLKFRVWLDALLHPSGQSAQVVLSGQSGRPVMDFK